ncbi:MAG: hypothetical protein WB780_00615 [Candidatus Acidiferrales bacterium]
MHKFLPIAAAALFAAVLSGQTLSPNAVADLRAHFAKETDPVRKARLLGPLGDAQFQEIRRQAADGDYSAALELVQQYRDEARGCLKALDAKEPDPEKHPSGFKQLQISLRASLRRVDDVIVGLAGDEQKPFMDVRKELEQMDRHLIRELFPRQPATESEPPKPKS